MKENHKLALYISYYLSRFNEDGLTKLNYLSWNDAFIDIAEKLNVNRHSVKNWRDEFDPIHGHRAGWHQRPMNPSRVRVIRALEGLEEEEIRSLVIDILNGSIKNDTNNFEELLKIFSNRNKNDVSKYILRGVTGKKAEEFFIEHFKKYLEPVSGNLVDTREKGCGYDFEIIHSKTYYVEVKGLSKESGGILFTNKEWDVAKQAKDKYYLAIVTNIETKPKISFIQNPASVLNPQKNIITTIQIQWSISANELQYD